MSTKKWCLFWLLSVGLFCSGCYVKSALVVKRLPPKAPGCTVDIFNEGRPLQAYMDKYELIGQGVLKDSSLSEKAKTVISDYVCEWGGDAAVFVPSGRGNLLGISAPESFYVSTFYAFRKLKEGEVPEAFKLVGITDENLKGKASFDHNCPVGSIIIEKRREDQGSGEYILNVCGTKKKYSRTGTVYQEVKE